MNKKIYRKSVRVDDELNVFIDTLLSKIERTHCNQKIRFSEAFRKFLNSARVNEKLANRIIDIINSEIKKDKNNP